MGFEEEFYALRNKKKKEAEKVLATPGSSFEREYYALRAASESEDIAPVVTTTTKKNTKKEEEEDDGFAFFQKGAFGDGYQFGAQIVQLNWVTI